MKKHLNVMRIKIDAKNLLVMLSFLFSLALLFIFFKPLLRPVVDNHLEFAYGDFSSIFGTYSALEKYQMIYFVFNQRWGAMELHIIRRFLLEGGISALANLKPTITDSQIASISILTSIILGCYGIFRLCHLFESEKWYLVLLIPSTSLFYFLNLWSAERLGHVWIWVTYAIIPLNAYFGLAFILNKNLKYLVAYSLLFGIYGIIPHSFICIFILHVFLSIFYIAIPDDKNPEDLLVFIGVPIVIYVLTNMPLFLLSFMAKGLEYPIPMSINQLIMTSRNGNLINILTFSNDWWPQVPATFFENPLFRITSLTLFIVAFSATLIKAQKEYRLLSLLSSMFITGLIFFAQGANNPVLLDIIHLCGQLGCIDIFAPFREWGRLSILIPIFLVLLLLSVATSLRGKKKSFLTFLCFILIIINITSSPSLVYVNEVYSPTYIPKEYYDLSNKISRDSKVLWIYPTSAQSILGTWRYVWNEQKAISQNLERSIGSTHNINLEYVKMLTKKEAPQQLLNALNIKYVIKRTDILGASNFKVEYQYLNCKKLEYLTVCENPFNTTLFYVSTILVLSDLDGKSFYAVTFPSPPLYATVVTDHRDNITEVAQFVSHDFASLWLYKVGEDKGVVLAPFRFTYFVNPGSFWSKASTADLLHADWHPYLEKFGIENWQSDYGKGLVFTWAVSRLEDNPTPNDNELIYCWVFGSSNDLSQWKNYTPENQLGSIYTITLDNKSLKAELWNSTWGWKTINSPLVEVEYGNWYRWEFQIKAENAHSAHVKIAEYNQDKKLAGAKQVKGIGSGTFGWQTITIDYTPENPETKYIQLQIWHGHETTQPLPNKIWIDNTKIYDLKRFTEPVTLEIPFTTPKTDEYVFLTRLFQNQQGGKIQIQLDNKNYTIDTKDQLNKFVWKQIDTLLLREGSHKITLTNIAGFNAVNLFALIPKREYQNAQNQIEQLFKGKRIIYILEAESDLYYQNSITSNKYGGEASNGIVLELDQTSKVWSEIEIIEPGNFTLAIRSRGNLTIKIDEKEYEISSSQLNWTYIGPINLERGNHTVEITNPMRPYLYWNFEKGDHQDWEINAPTMQTLTVDEYAYDGKYSLKAELNASAWGWKTINSPLIPVTPGAPYQFDFYVSGENAHNVHAKILEYDANKTYLTAKYMAGIGSGNFTWKNIRFEYTSSQNASYIQLQIWHGHETTQPLPNKVWLDNVKVYDMKGYQLSDVDMVWLYSTQNEKETLEDIFTSNENPAQVIGYQKIDPTKYLVKVNSTKPFMLSFAESYDPLWVAYVNGEKIQSIPLYGVINGFWINQTGILEITIEYEPQKWFYIGTIISATTLIACTTYLIYDWAKKKAILERIKKKLKPKPSSSEQETIKE